MASLANIRKPTGLGQAARTRNSWRFHGSRCGPIDRGGSCALVSSHPVPRNSAQRRIVDEDMRVTETTAEFGHHGVAAGSGFDT